MAFEAVSSRSGRRLVSAIAAMLFMTVGTAAGHAQSGSPLSEMAERIAKQCEIEPWKLALRREFGLVRVERSPTLKPAQSKCIDDALRAMKVRRSDDTSTAL